MTAPAFEEVPMPEAVAHASKGPVAFFVKWTVSGSQLRGHFDLYTADQLRAYGEQRANAALEALTAIARMDPDGVRADDLGRAARIATEAIRSLTTATARECLWTPDADGYWKTACGQGHTFTTDGPTENSHRFCCYCGGRISMKESGDADQA